MKNSGELLKFFLEGVQSLHKSVESEFSTLNENRINWKPDEYNWSIGECFDHIVLTHELYYEKLKAVDLANLVRSKNESLHTFRNSFAGKMILKSVHPDKIKKVKTFNIFKPEPESTPVIISIFRQEVEKIRTFAENLNNLDFAKIKIASPLSRFLKINLGEALLINLYHDQRHIKQAEKVLNHPDFPK